MVKHLCLILIIFTSLMNIFNIENIWEDYDYKPQVLKKKHTSWYDRKVLASFGVFWTRV